MKLQFTSQLSPSVETVVRLVASDQRADLGLDVGEAEFSAAENSSLHLHERKTFYVGIGRAKSADAATYRSAAGLAVRALQGLGRRHLGFDLRGHEEQVAAIVEGALLGAYRFTKFKKQDDRSAGVSTLSFETSAVGLAKARTAGIRAQILAESANYAREIANQPGNLFFPTTLADEARKLGREAGLRVTVFDEKKLRAGGFGGLLAVGGGSAHPPRLIVMEYKGGPASARPVALVGKAITFDSGGISIKPAANMEEMVWDKCGGIAVLGAMRGIARLKVRRNVVGVIASAENLPGPNSYRPGDVVTAYDGKTIEVLNTDAEGRVVLADAIGYARKDLKATAIIDLATLTGAIGVALGSAAAGLFTNSDDLKSKLLAASERSGERLWPMPQFRDYDKQIEGDVAQLKNTGGKLGGACTAAAFLKAFAGDTPWAHLDIAEMAAITKARPDLARGATGFGVRMLIELIDGVL